MTVLNRPPSQAAPTPHRSAAVGLTARDADGGSHLQSFLVTAIATILVTRVYLELSGFPQVGGGGLHVAHLLWGGLLMVVAFVIVFALLGRRAKRTAAVVGGIGFGLFIDELGKFVTSDNDYFFQPAIALIYLVFIALFLVFRAIEQRSLSPDELLVNAAEMAGELVLGGATQRETARALHLLEMSGAQGPLADALRTVVLSVQCGPDRAPSRLARFASRSWELYDALLAWRWFQLALLVVFVAQAVAGVLVAISLSWGLGLGELLGEHASLRIPAGVPLGPVGLGASLVSFAFVTGGVVLLRRSRIVAYRWFERGVLVSIFVGQVIMFWQDQLTALGGLAWDLVLLTALRFMIRQEEGRRALAAVPGAS